MRCADRLDWVAKWRLLNGYADRDGIEWTHPKMGALDLQYHDVDPELGLHRRLVRSGAMRRLFTDDEVARACTEPPERTRAYFRGRCVAQFSGALVAANWDSMVFDTGGETLKRVPMMEPLRGGKDKVEAILDRPRTPQRCWRRSAAEPPDQGRIETGSRTRKVSMAEQERKQAPQRQTEEAEEADEAAAGRSGRETAEKIDELLEEIDAVLEENAEEFVKNYVQKGGE